MRLVLIPIWLLYFELPLNLDNSSWGQRSESPRLGRRSNRIILHAAQSCFVTVDKLSQIVRAFKNTELENFPAINHQSLILSSFTRTSFTTTMNMLTRYLLRQCLGCVGHGASLSAFQNLTALYYGQCPRVGSAGTAIRVFGPW